MQEGVFDSEWGLCLFPAAECTDKRLGSNCCSSTATLKGGANVWMYPTIGFFIPYIIGMVAFRLLRARAKKTGQGDEALIKSETVETQTGWKKPGSFAMAMYIIGIIALVAEMTILP